MQGPTDFCGQATSLGAAEAIGDWDATIRGFLAHAAATPVHLGRVLEAAPDFAIAQATKGLFCMLLGRPEMVGAARQALDAAREAARQTTPTAREAAYIEALADYLSDRPAAAAVRLQSVLDANPRDALAMKLVHAIWFVLGRPGDMRASVEAVLPHWDDHPALGYLKGCHAFTLEETGEYAEAERAGREGILRAPDDAWGLHAVAHVYDMTGRAAEGLHWLVGRETAWAHCNNFRFHVWWHQALMHLDLGAYDEALRLYDSEIRAERTDDYRDISNGASLLSRLEIEGIDVGDRWQELADLAEGRAEDGCLAFADLHYLLSLLGGDRQDAAARLIAAMAQRDPEAGDCSAIIHHPGHMAALGLQAFSAGHYAAAFMHLRAARRDLQTIGGSHAQRDVFQRITVEAALRGGYVDAAESMLQERTVQRAGAEDGYTMRRLALISQVRDTAAVTSGSLRP